MNETVNRIIGGLTELIMQDKARLESERTHPSSSGPDQMDDRITFHEGRVTALRQLRESFEDQMSKVAL